VTIDYELCIGCAYCAVACPYQARYRSDRASFAYGEATEPEAQRIDPARLAVATKCSFCVERIDAGLAAGLKPGVDAEATPACVNACITQALAFGDADDPASKVSRLLAEHQHLRMHEELGTRPNFHYLWDRGVGEIAARPPEGDRSPMGGPAEGRRGHS
jgi:phenylacetyl-CoA:acceptor oxidoreductase subunit 1